MMPDVRVRTEEMRGQTRTVQLGRPVLLDALVGRLQRGARDPTHRRIGGRWLRASRTPEGPVLIVIAPVPDGVHGRAWGPGATWALDQLPALVGARDDPSGFQPLPKHPSLVEANRRFPHARVGRTGLVFEALSAAIIEQKVTGVEAYGAFRRLVQTYGEPAPGPARDPDSPAYGLCVPPDPGSWAAIPSWRFLQSGVQTNRSTALVRAARRAAAVERIAGRPPAEADRALRSLPGIGAWTSAEVRQRVHGDPDAWSVGDYHVGRDISWALTGEALDDDACAELLEPYRGHRYRVQTLLALAGRHRPRRAPRMALPTHTPDATSRRHRSVRATGG